MNVTNYRSSDQLLYEDLCLEKPLAFRFLYQQVYDTCMPYALKNGMTLELAEDLLQDCLAIFLEKLRSKAYQWQSGAKVSSFFYKIFQNQCLKQHKKIARSKETMSINVEDAQASDADTVLFTGKAQDSDDDESFISAIEDQAYNEEERQWIFNKLQRAFDLLRDDCRLVLQLFYVEDASLQVIADALQLTLDSATQKRFKCAKYLKEKFRLSY